MLQVTCNQAADHIPGPGCTFSITSQPFLQQQNCQIRSQIHLTSTTPSHLLATQLQELSPRWVRGCVWVPPWLETSLNSIIKITSFRGSNSSDFMSTLWCSPSLATALPPVWGIISWCSFHLHLLLSSLPSSDHSIPTILHFWHLFTYREKQGNTSTYLRASYKCRKKLLDLKVAQKNCSLMLHHILGVIGPRL